MGVVKTNHDGQVLFDPADEEFKECPALVLVLHLLLQLLEQWLKLFRRVQAWHFTGRDQRVE